MPKQKYSSIVNQIQNRLYELHQTESYLENTLITFSDTNDLTFVKYSSLDKETNVITNSEIEYIEIDDYCSSIGLNSINAENIDNWLEKRNFNTWEANLAPMQVNNRKLWKQIQENPQMSEKEFLKIVEKMKVEKKKA